MYAGGLNKRFGLELLIDAFKEIEGDYELWLFGSGDYESDIIKQSEIDTRIKYFGKVDREVVLGYEMKSTLLVNLRNPADKIDIAARSLGIGNYRFFNGVMLFIPALGCFLNKPDFGIIKKTLILFLLHLQFTQCFLLALQPLCYWLFCFLFMLHFLLQDSKQGFTYQL